MSNIKWTDDKIKVYVEDQGYDLLGVSRNKRVYLNVRCSSGHTYSTELWNFIKGKRCQICYGNKRLSFEDVKKYIENDSKSGCKLLSENYINAHESLIMECACGDKFKTTFDKFKFQNKRQCNLCGKKNIANSRLKNHNVFIQEVYNLVKDEYEIKSQYKINHSHVLMKHNICGNEYPVSPANFLRGKRCPYCAGSMQKTHQQFVDEISQKYNNEYIVLSNYEKASKKVKIRHNICGFEYEVVANSILRGNQCPWCTNRFQDTERFNEWIKKHCNGEYLVIGEYTTAQSNIRMKHIVCNHEFEVTPNNFKKEYGTRCPICNESKGEKRIRKWLKENDIDFTPQHRFNDCRDKKPLPFDFAIKIDNEIKLLCEYDGIQHFGVISGFITKEGYENTKHHDNIKTQYCIDNNISLLRIPYTEFNNIEQILSEHILQ